MAFGFRRPGWQGSLPRDWTLRRLGDLVTCVNGHPFPSEEFGPTGHTPIVRIRDLLASEFETFTEGSVPPRARLRDHDLVIGMDGDFNVVYWDRGPAALNQRLCLLRPREGVDIRFVFYTLPDILRIINDLTFSTTVKHLASSDLLSEEMPCPPLDEQRRIAGYLDAETARLDHLSGLRYRQLALLDERRFAFVRAAVAGLGCGESRPADLGWVNQVPLHWEVVPLKYVARYGSGHTPSRTHPEYWANCDIPWISLFDVGRMRDPRQVRMYETTQQISALGMANSSARLHPAGTVVMSRTASVGFSTIMGTDMAVSQHFATWTCGPRISPEYLLHVLRAMKQTWESLQVGTTNVTVFMPDLLALQVPLPPMDEQVHIVGRIEAATKQIDDLARSLQQQRDLLVERREAVITAAVTGQLDVATARGAA
jgi:type I restriction enzyme S subunit